MTRITRISGRRADCVCVSYRTSLAAHQTLNTKAITKLFYVVAMLLLVLVLGGLCWKILRPYEPAYEGKSLSVWLRQFEEAKSNWGAERDALVASGYFTNVALAIIRAEEPPDT